MNIILNNRKIKGHGDQLKEIEGQIQFILNSLSKGGENIQLPVSTGTNIDMSALANKYASKE